MLYLYIQFIYWLLLLMFFMNTYLSKAFNGKIHSAKDLEIIYGLPAYKRCDCGRMNHVRGGNERIIGGNDMYDNQFPWLVLITHNNSVTCGGSIISDRYILTAAHCLSATIEQRDLKVLIGEHDRCTTDTKTIIFSVDEIIQHPQFSSIDYNADIMLLRLSMRLTFNKYIQPICLPLYDFSGDVVTKYEGKFATVAGWGTTDVNSPDAACIPKQLDLPILGKRQCSIGKSPSLFCAGYEDGGKDSCQGDSGGPLQILKNKNQYELVGVVSSGIGCAVPGNPGLYTDVSRYLPWIRRHTSNSGYCL